MWKLIDVYSKIRDYLLAGSVVALVAASVGWYTTDLKLDAAKVRIKFEQQSRILDRTIYEKAQAEAANIAYEEKIKKDEENAKKAAKADADYNALLSRYNASILRYQASQTADRPSGSIHMSSSSTSSDGSHFTSESTEISISIEDAGICAENTARLSAVRSWATGLGFEDITP